MIKEYNIDIFASEKGKEFCSSWKGKSDNIVYSICKVIVELDDYGIYSDNGILSLFHLIPGEPYCKSITMETARSIRELFLQFGSETKLQKISSMFKNEDIFCIFFFDGPHAKNNFKKNNFDIQYDIIEFGGTRNHIGTCSKKTYNAVIQEKLKSTDNILKDITLYTPDLLTKYKTIIKELYNEGEHI